MTSLILRSIIWRASEEELQTSIIGCRDIESLGCDIHDMFIAARRKLGNDVNVFAEVARGWKREGERGYDRSSVR